MSADQLNTLLSEVSRDKALAARFTEVSTAQEAAEVATKLGFDVTAEEIESAGAHRGADELSDAELAGVAGGGSPSLDPMLCPTGHCQSMYGLGCG